MFSPILYLYIIFCLSNSHFHEIWHKNLLDNYRPHFMLWSRAYLSPPVTPRPLLGPRIVTRNDFKNHRLAPQITISFSSMLRPLSHAAQKTSQEVTHLQISPQQARLTMEFQRVDSWKRRCIFTDISSYFNPFKSHSGCYE